jgi:hypothetical protein
MTKPSHDSTGPPPAALILILLLALGSLGVGFGLWSKTLTIEGSVHTGEVDARWTGASCTEFHTWPDLPSSPADQGELLGKDVGDWDISVDPQDDQILHFTIWNGYPSYAVDCQVHFEVEGTIPVIVRGTAIWPGPELTNCTLSGSNNKTLVCDQLTVIFTDNLGSQLHPGDEAASSLTVHVEQPAQENDLYTFDVGVCMAQWNEGATAAECFAAAP